MIETRIIPAINSHLNPRGLQLSQEKTHIAGIETGIDFLGQNLRRYNGRLIIKPAKKNEKAFLDKVRRIIKLHRGNKAGELIKALNPRVRGWANYHRSIPAAKTFSYIENAIWHSLWRWAKRQHSNKSGKWLARKYWNQIPGEKRPWIFTARIKDKAGKTQLIRLTRLHDIKLMRYIKIKGKSNPYEQTYQNYFRMRQSSRNGCLINNN